MGETITAVPLRRNRDFHLIWVGGTLAGLGSRMAALALPLLVLQQTGSTAKAGLVGSISAATLLIAIIPAGAVADAVERHRLMRYCELAGSLIAAALAATVLAGSPAMPAVVITSVAVAILGSLYAPAAIGLLRAAVPADQLGLAMSRLQARNAATQIAGPLAGGALFGVAPALPFAVQAGAMFVSFGCLLTIRTRSRPAPDATRLTPRQITAGFRFLWQQRYLRTILIVYGAGMNATFSALMLVTITASAHADPSGRSSGLIVALASIGSLAGALAAPRLRSADAPHTVLTLTSWCIGAATLLFVVVTQPLAQGLLLAVVLFLSGVANVAFETEQARLTPTDLAGRVEAAAIFISMIAQPLGPLGGGLLAEAYGPATAFLVIGALIAIVAGFLTLSFRRINSDTTGRQ
ncbi:putative MFS family arabinose efflux permease [Herbihabitans rhizosphaerae]|uniref:Putative MFS family arabinose efflux permease n=1 Tax=Herbihabitans rhizosphaerae TaxID=1872711 RepID=A0A4Q7L3W1_9PSEU|nr:MFS transporter [Herbihabitans rhizosphaerae]RZS44308.1 putative MFS family arabinose efflux permease [Herbihabitans rhizosphaerae]